MSLCTNIPLQFERFGPKGGDILTRILKTLLIAGAMSMPALADPAMARELKFAIGFTQASAPYKGAMTFAEEVEKNSGGELTVRVFPVSLLDLKETPPGLRDGIADVGYVIGPYYPKEFATTNLVAELSMIASTKNPTGLENAAFIAAAAEYFLFNCGDCQKEFDAQNQVYLGQAASPPMVMNCTKPVTNLEQVKGLRLRTSSSNFGRWATHVGGVPVALPAQELFEGLSQGVVDCIVVGSELFGLRLIDVVKHITVDVPGGIFGGAMPTNVNKDVWKELTDKQRRVIIDAAATNMAHTLWNYNQIAKDEFVEVEKRGIGLHKPEADLQEATAKFIEADLGKIAERYKTDFGVADADKIAADFRVVYDKWVARIPEMSTVDDFRKALLNELFSKIDEKTYGL